MRPGKGKALKSSSDLEYSLTLSPWYIIWGIHLDCVYTSRVYRTLVHGDIDSVSSSSGSVEITMELPHTSFNMMVWNFDTVCLGEQYVHTFREGVFLSNTGEESDFIVEPCISGEKVREVLGIEENIVSLWVFLEKMTSFNLKKIMSLLAKEKSLSGEAPNAGKSDSYVKKIEAYFKKKFKEMQEAHDLKDSLTASANKRIVLLEKELESLKTAKTTSDSGLKETRGKLPDDDMANEDLKTQLFEQEKLVESLNVKLEAMVMEGLLVGDLGFDKVKSQALFLYLSIDLYELGFFKFIWDGNLMMEEDTEAYHSLKDNTDPSPSPVNIFAVEDSAKDNSNHEPSEDD
ncbi:unnamed protein product [Vicia faba]|uniref:Uncharacterized protein n=1 Tax=Vicia faba TaxID=3906 RepID=A0AAV0YKD9_VICFA|nr:unnamed protein product [Vicia faba]